jgi:ABC-type hemin transport system ATPase subunit
MNPGSVLEVQSVTVRFGGLTALNAVSLAVPPRHVMGVIGPNGAGKTTLLNVLCGFIRPDDGLFREYYEHPTRGYARGVRAAQLAREVDAQYDPEVIAFAYTGIGNFVGMRWADWTAGGQVPEDVLNDVLQLLARGLPPQPEATEPADPAG